MDDEAELIRGQMQETREALTDKLEALEQQVVGTVQTAASSVAETVENVTESVQETVGTVKESVEETVVSIKESLSVSRQVERHPWAMFLGSVAVGFAGTRWLDRSSQARAAELGTFARAAEPRDSRAVGFEVPPAPRQETRGPSVAEKLAGTFRSELDALKGLGVSMLGAVLRDVITQSVSPAVAPRVAELLDDFTEKMGGKPIRGPILKSPESQEETEEEKFRSQWDSDSEMPAPPENPRPRGHAGNGGHGMGRERRF